MNRWWLEIQDEAGMDRLLQYHPALAEADMLGGAVRGLPPAFERSEHARLLRHVVTCLNRKVVPHDGWDDVHEQIRAMLPERPALPATSALGFYVPYYAQAAGWLAGKSPILLASYSDRAIWAAEMEPDKLYRAQWKGLLGVQWGRILGSLGSRDASAICAVGGRHLVKLFEAVRGRPDRLAAKAVAAEIVRLRTGWRAMVPGASIDDCPVAADLCEAAVKVTQETVS